MKKLLEHKCFFYSEGDCNFLFSAKERCTGLCNCWKTYDKPTLRKFKIKKVSMSFYDLLKKDKRYKGVFGADDEVQTILVVSE